MNPTAYERHVEALKAIISDSGAHKLDRIDACLELSQVVEKDIYQRARLVQQARDLLQVL